MLYLAEVDKGFGRKTTLQLLAKQGQDQSWTPVTEEVIPSEEAGKFNAGVLVLVEVTPNRQGQNLREAARPLITYLQNFSRLQQQSGEQEKEIEQWKQSLTFQSQELNRRLMEVEAQEERFLELEENYQKYEAELESLNAKKVEIEALEAHIAEQQQHVGQQREAIQQQQAELEEQRANLTAQQEALVAQLKAVQQSRLSDEEVSHLHQALDQVTAAVQAWPASLTPLLAQLQEQLGERQAALAGAIATWQTEQEATQQQQNQWDQAWQQAQETKEAAWQARLAVATLMGQEQAYRGRQSLWQQQRQVAIAQAQSLAALQQQTEDLIAAHDCLVTGEVAPQPRVSPEEVQAQVEFLQRELEQHTAQVQQQETELQQNQQQLADLRNKLAEASPDDRFDVEMDIDYAQAACQALEEALAPQRRTLQREQEELAAQQAILAQLTGEGTDSGLPQIDVSALVSGLQALQQQQQQVTEWAEQQWQATESELAQVQAALATQQESANGEWQAWLATEASLLAQQRDLAMTRGRLNTEQQIWAAEQATLSTYLAQFEQIQSMVRQPEATWETPMAAIRETLATLVETSAPELVSS